MSRPAPAAGAVEETVLLPRNTTARKPGQRRGLAFRIGAVTIAVALLSVSIAAVVTFGLIRAAAADQAQRQLGREAELVAGLTGNRPVAPRVRRSLAETGTKLVTLLPSGQQVGAFQLPERDRWALVAGRPVSTVARAPDGGRVFVEGRPTATGGAVALVQDARLSPADQSQFLRRLLVAVAVGVVGGVLASVLLANRLARPLRRAAVGARKLASGTRSVRIQPEGPHEVAEVAEAVNTLATALQASEQRQRDFLMSVSHELRSPLTSIKGFADALADGVVDAEDSAGAGQIMRTEASRLERLVGDLLDLARLEAQDFVLDTVSVDLRRLLRDAGQVWLARCDAAGIRFRLEEPGHPVLIATDPTRVRQIIDGLTENALRVTPTGAPIVLALRVEPPWAVLEIRDGGPGLRAEDLAVVFQRGALYRKYRGIRQGGSGLGLALVHRLALRLGGNAAAGAAPEGGARFTIWLPHPPAPTPPTTPRHE